MANVGKLVTVSCGCGGQYAQYEHEKWTSDEELISCNRCGDGMRVDVFWLTVRAERAERLVDYWSARYSALWYEHRAHTHGYGRGDTDGMGPR